MKTSINVNQSRVSSNEPTVAAVFDVDCSFCRFSTTSKTLAAHDNIAELANSASPVARVIFVADDRDGGDLAKTDPRSVTQKPDTEHMGDANRTVLISEAYIVARA